MSIFRSSLFFSFGTLLSRLFGLLRESIIAGVFGATWIYDAFLVANRIPNMLRDMAAEGALGSAFTKVFSQRWRDEDPKRAKDLLRGSLWFFGPLILLVCLIGMCFAPFLVQTLMLFSHQSRGQEFFEQTVFLTRVLFPFISFMSLASILSGALYQKGRFFLASIAPIALSCGYILGALVIGPFLQKYHHSLLPGILGEPMVFGLCLGVLLGGFAQMMLCYYRVKKLFFSEQRFLFKKQEFFSSDIKKILILTGPAVLAASSAQLNVFVNTNFATSLESGAVSWLNYSFRILQLPVGVFAVGLGAVLLPLLSSRAGANNSHDVGYFKQKLTASVVASFWVLVPCSFLLFWASTDIIDLLYRHGKFSKSSAVFTAQALSSYAFGLCGYGLIKVLTSFYYAFDDTKFAMKVSLVSVGVNFFLNLLLVKNFGFRGLALSTSLVMSINALWLYLGLARKNLSIDWSEIKKLAVFLFWGVGLSMLGCSFLVFLFKNYTASGMLSLKLRSFLQILCYFLCVVVVFGTLLCRYYQKSARELLLLLKEKKGS